MLTIALVAYLTGAPLNILFLGNSHTAANDLPAMVENLIERRSVNVQVRTKSYSSGFLEELANIQELKRDIQSKKWHTIVMQGAKLSSSHKYEYDHSGAVQIAKLAIKNGLRTWLFAEWPRKGWNETAYILKEYQEIAGPSGAKIVPVGRVWDRLLADRPNLELWSADGNHASLLGSYVAACSIAAYIYPPQNSAKAWHPSGIDPNTANNVDRTIRNVIANPSKSR